MDVSACSVTFLTEANLLEHQLGAIGDWPIETILEMYRRFPMVSPERLKSALKQSHGQIDEVRFCAIVRGPISADI